MVASKAHRGIIQMERSDGIMKRMKQKKAEKIPYYTNKATLAVYLVL